MPRPIATNRRVDRDELLAFVRPRHHVILATTRSDGSAQVSPVTARRRRRRSARRLDLSAARRRCANLRRRPDRVGVRLVGRMERPVGPGRRHRRGARSPGRVGAADRVLPKHLGRAPGLGRVPRRDAGAREVSRSDQYRAMGSDRDRGIPTRARHDRIERSPQASASRRSRQRRRSSTMPTSDRPRRSVDRSAMVPWPTIAT